MGAVAPAAPAPVAPPSTGPAPGGSNGSGQKVLASGSKEGGPGGSGIPQTPEAPQGQGRTPADIEAARGERQSRNGTGDLIEGGFGTGEPPGDIMANVAAGADRPGPSVSGHEAAGGQPGASGTGRESVQPGTPDQPEPLPTPDQLMLQVANIEQVAREQLSRAVPQGTDPNAPDVQAGIANGVNEGVVAYLRDIAARPGGADLLQQAGENNPQLRPLIEAAKKPAQSATEQTPPQGSAPEAASSRALDEPIAQVIREQDFAVAAARKSGDGVEAALEARRKAVQDAIHGAIAGLTPEEQADFVLNQLAGRLSEGTARQRIDAQQGRFLRGAFREFRFHFSAGRQEISDLYKLIKENPALMQDGIIDAVAYGNGVHDKDTEERMGNILRHIHNRNMGPIKRLMTEIPGLGRVARWLPKTAGEKKRIAELQLQALSGQMSQEDLDKYKKGPLLWRLVQVILAVTAPVAWEAVSDSAAQQTQPTR